MYQDFLIRIKNAQASRRETVQAPFTMMDFAIAQILAKSGFVHAVEKKTVNRRPILEVELAYRHGRGAISGLKFLSTPSRRLYTGYRDLRTVRQGHGLMIISTPRGVLTGSEAKSQKVGGEQLFQVW